MAKQVNTDYAFCHVKVFFCLNCCVHWNQIISLGIYVWSRC